MTLPREIEERFERIEAILENAGKRLDHAGEVIDRAGRVIDRMAPLVEETWTLARQNEKTVQAHLASHEEPEPILHRPSVMAE